MPPIFEREEKERLGAGLMGGWIYVLIYSFLSQPVMVIRSVCKILTFPGGGLILRNFFGVKGIAEVM